jgi:hypothetical protein
VSKPTTHNVVWIPARVVEKNAEAVKVTTHDGRVLTLAAAGLRTGPDTRVYFCPGQGWSTDPLCGP